MSSTSPATGGNQVNKGAWGTTIHPNSVHTAISSQEIDGWGNVIVTGDAGEIVTVLAADVLAAYTGAFSNDYDATCAWIRGNVAAGLPGETAASLVAVTFDTTTGQITAFSISNP
jgi:hypothetical protein